MCGIFGISNAPDAARLARLGLFALQHRGQESAGIVSITPENSLRVLRGKGLISEVCSENALRELQGKHALGHVRYSTAGGTLENNVQPLVASIAGKSVALAHNGNIVNAAEIRLQLESDGAILQGTADSELILHLLARRRESDFGARLAAIAPQLEGAYSLLFLTSEFLYGMVDPHGYRPMLLGRMQNSSGAISWILASETSALDLVGAEMVRAIAPGELVRICHATGTISEQQYAQSSHRHCSFEQIYFARPDAMLWGKNAGDARLAMGRALAREHPADADIVIGIPDSGLHHALGFSEESGIPFAMGLIRNHYIGRTFIEPTDRIRNLHVRLKLNPVRAVVNGKRIVVIDDSLVRGTTARNIMELLHEAGAKEIHLRLGAPPVRFPCFYGIDTPKHSELLAQNMTLPEIQDFLRVDSLGFLSVDSLQNVLGQNYCIGCFNGIYHDPSAQALGNPERSFEP